MLLLLLLLVCGAVTPQALTEVYRWKGGEVEVAWPNTSWARRYGQLSLSVIGIKVWRDKIYLTAPRWHGNVSC